MYNFNYTLDPHQYLIAGCDEVGRGPLVGNVVAACVVLDHNNLIAGLNDSKKLSEKKRELLYDEIIAKAKAYAIVSISPQTIDKINILNASLLAMQEAYLQLNLNCNLLLIDGNKKIKDLAIAQECVVKGDSLVPEIMAASILAKVTRDRQMLDLDAQYPHYGFKQHKGYPTKAHLSAIAQYGILDCYRKSYGPIKKILEAQI